MPFDLPTLARQRRIRRAITLRPIQTSKAQATDLATILLRPLTVWQAAIPQIMAGYTPSSLTQDSPADMTSAIDRAANEVERLIVTITAQLRTFSIRVETWQRQKWAASVAAGVGIDLTGFLTTGPVQETLEEFLSWNVALVRDVSEQVRGKISNVIYAGNTSGIPPREMTKQLNEAVNLGRARSRRIAIDQTQKLAARLTDERHAEAGIELVKWRSSHKLHARPHHAARDGKVFDLKTHKPVDGGEAVPRGDWVGQPPYCGCQSQAYIDLLDELE